jgi:hypothetical protein
MSDPIPTVRECPRCAEEIKNKALVCKHCGFDIPKLALDENNNSKINARRKRSSAEVAKTIDNAIFDAVYDNHKIRITSNNIDNIRGLTIKWPRTETCLHFRHPSGSDDRITHDVMIKRAKELGVIYDDSEKIAIANKRELLDKEAQREAKITIALVTGFFTIVVIWFIIAAISPKPLSGREKAMELYCNRSGVTCGPDTMKRIFRD